VQLLLFGSLLLLGSLFALTGLRQFVLEPLESTQSNVIWFLIQVLPLVAVLPGMLRLQARAYFLAVLVASLYFVHGILLMVGEALRTLGIWETGFSLTLILAATYMVRLLRAINDPEED
jgi:uncharacterized membrane protein